MIETTRLHCHDCGGYFTVDLDMDLNGQHEIVCPNCQHIHYRIVKDGVVTEERYRSSSWLQTHSAATYNFSATTTSSNNAYCVDLWASSTTASTTNSGW